MKRMVYSPKVEVFIKADSGVYDISPYVESCSVARKVNQVSTATVKFRNPQFIWTNRKTVDTTGLSVVGPVFHPMDPITITMTRINNRPIQVFTGFCDTTPYLQLYPGTCTLTASCTLKRILHTYWDPGLPFVKQFLQGHGWSPDPKGGISAPAADSKAQNSKTLIDAASIGGLLYDVLVEIGGWSEDTIYIENLPTNIVDTVSKIYDQVNADSKQSQDELNAFLKKVIGTGSAGTALPVDSGGTQTGTLSKAELVALATKHHFPDPNLAAAVALAESSGQINNLGHNPNPPSDDLGLWQINDLSHPDWAGTRDIGSGVKSTSGKRYRLTSEPDYNAAAAFAISNHGTSWTPWSTYTSGAYKKYL